MLATNIALSGLTASMQRLTVSASNVANAETSGVTVKGAVEAREAGIAPATAYQPIALYQAAVVGGGVVARIVPSSGTVATYDPSSPNADSSGMIETPNVDLVDERVEQIRARDAYQANVAVLRATNQMERSLLDVVA